MSSAALATVNNGIARVEELDFSQQQIELIRHSLGMEKASELEFDLFINLCKAKRLDPLTKQMYAVPFRGRWQMFASIDGLRVIAQRTTEYGGQTAPYWCGPDLIWREAWLENEAPAAAKVGVYKRGYPHPTWGVATFRSYGKGKAGNWESMPDVMLAKCAEAQALRKAFPDDLSALYVREEFEDAQPAQSQPGRPSFTHVTRLSPEEMVFEERLMAPDAVDEDTGEMVPEESLADVKRQIRALTKEAEWSNDDLGLVAAELNLPSWVKMTLGEAQLLRDVIQERLEEAQEARLHLPTTEMQAFIDAEARVAGEAGDDGHTR